MTEAPRALPPPLTSDVLQRRLELPVKPDAVQLEGVRFRLEPLDPPRHRKALFELTCGRPMRVGDMTCEAYDPDEWVWRYLSEGPFADEFELEGFLDRLVDAPDRLALCVVHKPTEHPVGVATFMSNVPSCLRIELGNIWYGPVAQRSGANLEATLLMLEHAFALGYHRVEWKCNSLNERSRRAALRMGFTFEGIQEQHMIIKDRNRDTAWFRMLEREWPEIGPRLRSMRDRQFGLSG